MLLTTHWDTSVYVWSVYDALQVSGTPAHKVKTKEIISTPAHRHNQQDKVAQGVQHK
jgi:hypothetical protein